ncbi:hypothetical protein J6590_091623, partial [Homalodisca vitripennis]
SYGLWEEDLLILISKIPPGYAKLLHADNNDKSCRHRILKLLSRPALRLCRVDKVTNPSI